jgi:hypothetical protein
VYLTIPASWRVRGEVMAASSPQDRNTIQTRSFLVIRAGLLEETNPAQQSRGTRAKPRAYSSMTDEKPTDKTGNEPAPLLLAAVAIVPLLAVAGWLFFG